jgi:hypothetical protein
MSTILEIPAGLTALDLERIISIPEASKLTSLSDDTIERRFGHFIVQLSPRRRGMKLRNALAITNGIA